MKPRPKPAAGAPCARTRSRPWRQWLVIVLLASPLAGRAAFFLRNEGRFLILEDEVGYRIDLPPTAPIEQVLATSDGWLTQRDKPFQPASEPLSLWARFELPSVGEPRQVLLDTSPWETVDYYFVRDGRVVDHQRTGIFVPLADRATRVTMTGQFLHGGFVALELQPGTRAIVYARLASNQRFGPIRWLKFYLWDTAQVLKGERRDRTFQCIYLGVLLVLIIYNLALFIIIRERSHLYYVLMVVGGGFIWGALFGLTDEFLSPHWSEAEIYGTWIGAFGSGWAGCQFVRRYLGTDRILPRDDALLRGLGVANLVLAAAFFLLPLLKGRFAPGGPVMFGAAALWFAVLILILLVVVVRAVARGHPPARFFLGAVLVSCVGSLVTGAALLQLLPSTEITLQAGQIGTCITGIVLSLGLGFRMQRLRTEAADRQLAHEREKLDLVEEHNRGLETKVRERTAELAAAREKSDSLLANILPQAIIEELTAKGETEPRRHEEVSMLFTDFSGFTQTVATIPPKRLVQELDEIFRGFDDIVAAHGLEKIKTIGDAYMTASGLPLPAADHAVRSVRAALALTRFIETRNTTAAMKWGLRVGIHSGAVVAGIVGKHKYAYDVWGDTVNIASRLESASEPGRVNISAYTYELVRDRFVCEYRGKLAAKGKGAIDMYFVGREITGSVVVPST